MTARRMFDIIDRMIPVPDDDNPSPQDEDDSSDTDSDRRVDDGYYREDGR